jgi:hypothetical protein
VVGSDWACESRGIAKETNIKIVNVRIYLFVARQRLAHV